MSQEFEYLRYLHTINPSFGAGRIRVLIRVPLQNGNLARQIMGPHDTPFFFDHNQFLCR
jgi:hypothetical protein